MTTRGIRCLFGLALILSQWSAYGQDFLAVPRTWSVHLVRSADTGVEMKNCQFATGNDQVRLEMPAGHVLKTFRVMEAEGEWPDILADGRVVLKVVNGNESGYLKFEREEGRLSGAMFLADDAGNATLFALEEVSLINPGNR